MNQPELEADPLHPGSRRNAIYRLGRERFTELVQGFNPEQLVAIKGTHKYLENVSNIIICMGTIMSLQSSISFRLTQHPELFDNIAFGILTIIGGYAGAVGSYYRSATREGISIISSRSTQLTKIDF